MNETKALREFTMSAARAAISAADPAVCIQRSVRVDQSRLLIKAETVALSTIDRVSVVGMGKASAAMAQALEELLGSRISGGIVITADGYAVPTQQIEVREAKHPTPDSRGLSAASQLSELVRQAGANDLVIVLISGGGSSLLTLPIPNVSIDELATTNELLLRAGVPIQEINAVRKHLSAVKGGRLAALAYPARVVALILSDVPGDRLDTIASGPTAPDPTTYQDAREIVQRAGLWNDLPSSVRKAIGRGVRGEIEETLKSEDSRFRRVSNVIIGGGRTAAKAAWAFAQERGFSSAILTSTLQGEARVIGPLLASIGREVIAHEGLIAPPALVIATGETTVTVVGPGRGGRNQEVALSAAPGIEGVGGIVVCSIGTDGQDGPTNAAGGLVDGGSAARIRAAGLRIRDVLQANASYDALSSSGDLVVTGPTMTNVADIALIAVATT